MNTNRKRFWLGLALLNLAIVALFGFLLRSKILFPIPLINYRNLLSAHSHFAFSGWVGLSIFTLLVYSLLPPAVAAKRVYQWMLAGIEISSLGMALTFPFWGYTGLSIFFSTLYIVVNYVMAPVFIRDVWQTVPEKTIRLLATVAIASLLLSALGPLGLVYILSGRSTDAILYRDSIYTFLHFQYNGFFTLSVFALFFQFLYKQTNTLPASARRFAIFLCLSVLPALFLSLLWHGKMLYNGIAAMGALLILLALAQIIPLLAGLYRKPVFTSRVADTFLIFSLLSFVLKMVLNVGTLIPSLGNAVYGDRPVIIGFLHLVFLGFVSFFLLAWLLQHRLLPTEKKSHRLPLYLFAFGIITNELLLAAQGLGILFKTNSSLYSWLLWGSSIFLVAGACGLAWNWWGTKKAATALS